MQVRPVTGDVNNCAAFEHEGKSAVEQGELRITIDAHGIIRVSGYKVAFQSAGSIEYQEVQVATPLSQRGKKSVYIFRLCYIATYSKRTHPAPRDFSGNLVSPCSLITIGNCYVITMICQGEGCGSSDATRSAGDECHRLSDGFHCSLLLTEFLLPLASTLMLLHKTFENQASVVAPKAHRV